METSLLGPRRGEAHLPPERWCWEWKGIPPFWRGRLWKMYWKPRKTRAGPSSRGADLGFKPAWFQLSLRASSSRASQALRAIPRRWSPELGLDPAPENRGGRQERFPGHRAGPRACAAGAQESAVGFVFCAARPVPVLSHAAATDASVRSGETRPPSRGTVGQAWGGPGRGSEGSAGGHRGSPTLSSR